VAGDANIHDKEEDKRDVKDWKAALRSVIAHTGKDRVNVAAGAFAFRWFLALFPVIIALLGFASLVSLPRGSVVSLVHGVTKALPAGAAGVLATAITHVTDSKGRDLPATVIAGAVALWSATSGMVMLEEGLDMAYELPRDRSFVAKRLVAMPLLAGITVLGGASSALVIFGAQLGSAIKEAVPMGVPRLPTRGRCSVGSSLWHS
jgi:uncharacterized BrkB/YihY/UPF0761 family membrane protein